MNTFVYNIQHNIYRIQQSYIRYTKIEFTSRGLLIIHHYFNMSKIDIVLI